MVVGVGPLGVILTGVVLRAGPVYAHFVVCAVPCAHVNAHFCLAVDGVNLVDNARKEVVDSLAAEGEPVLEISGLPAYRCLPGEGNVGGEAESVDAFVLHVGGELGARGFRKVGKQVVEAAAVEHNTVNVILREVGNDAQQVCLYIVVAGVEEARCVIVVGRLRQVHTVNEAFSAVVDGGPALL